ncbi:MAG: ribose-phosphate pyrophosphokinase [Gammaproteobacteria bacterium]
MQIFALDAGRAWGEKVAAHLQVPLARHEERDFEDGEHKIRPIENVRGREVFVIHSLYSEPGQSVNDKICRLLFFIGALKDASARRVVAVIPYLAYARKDRKTKTRDPVSMKYMAKLLEAAGADHLVTLDVHNIAAFQNAFRIPTDHLEARVVFTPRLVQLLGEEEMIVVSPDPGGVKRAEQLRETLSALLEKDISNAFLEKKRSMGKVSGETLVGDVKGRTAIIIDDIISSGTTINRAVNVLQEQGATRILAAVSHGIFAGNAMETLANPALEKLLLTDSIPPFRLPPGIVQDRLDIASAAPLFAEAMKRIYEGNSVTDLLNEYPQSTINGTG